MKKILFIEDNPDFYDPITELLKYNDYKVKIIRQPDDAIDNIEKIKKYDLVILDLMFIKGEKVSLEEVPEVGIFLYQKIREKYPKLPIIITTAMSKQNCWHYFENDQFVDFQNKPILSNYNIFLDKINRLI